MHKVSTKQKLHFNNLYLTNLYVTLPWLKNYARGDLTEKVLSTGLFRNTIYQMHPSYQTSGLTLKKKKQNKTKQKKKRISYISLNPKTKRISPAGNRIPVSRVTRRGTQHYTTEKLSALDL